MNRAAALTVTASWLWSGCAIHHDDHCPEGFGGGEPYECLADVPQDSDTLGGAGAGSEPEFVETVIRPAAAPPPEPACPLGFGRGGSGECLFDPVQVSNLMANFQNARFMRANTEPFIQQFGDPNLRNVWVSDTYVELEGGIQVSALAVYLDMNPNDHTDRIAAPMPVGTMLIHHNLHDPQAGLMMKRESGFNPMQNDWEFSRYLPDGTRVPIMQGPYNQTCMDCHTMDNRGERTDLLWGVPHLDRLQ